MQRAPMLDGDEIEIRQLFELSDFDMSAETKALHENIEQQAAALKK